MADWDKVRKNLGNAAQKAKKKTGEFASDASMQIKLKSLERKRDQFYEQLGKLTYRQLKTGESQAEKIAETIEALDDIRAKHRAQAELIEKIKRERAEKKNDFDGESEESYKKES